MDVKSPNDTSMQEEGNSQEAHSLHPRDLVSMLFGTGLFLKVQNVQSSAICGSVHWFSIISWEAALSSPRGTAVG